MEILVTTKDPEHKAKAFEKCLDVIKSAGVRAHGYNLEDACVVLTVSHRRKSVRYQKMRPLDHLQKTGNVPLGTFLKKSKKSILLQPSL